MCDGDNSRIIKADLDGRILGVSGPFGKNPGKIDIPHYIAVDSTGSIYAADFRNWRVDKFVTAIARTRRWRVCSCCRCSPAWREGWGLTRFGRVQPATLFGT
jgi:hypothetical protein